jgi:hypothetical protein
MPIIPPLPADRVVPVKIESTDLGGDQNDAFYVPADTNSDHLEARGYVIQNDTSRDDQVGISRDSGDNLLLWDPNAGIQTLSDLLGGGTGINEGHLDVSIAQGESEAFGIVTGFVTTPNYIGGFTIYERDNGVAQSGFSYVFNPYELTADGFKWRVAFVDAGIIDDDYWPGPGPVILRVSYLWK